MATACHQTPIREHVVTEESRTPRTSYADAIARTAPSVVSIYTFTTNTEHLGSLKLPETLYRKSAEQGGAPSTRKREIHGLGSGVVISDQGHILTSGHVVEEADRISAVAANGDQFDAKVVGVDEGTDLAVLKIEPKKLPKAVLGDSSGLRVGDIVLAIGNSFGVGQTVTSGIISATDRAGFGMSQYEDFIQTDAPINPGNSGGALTDANGRVIGINSAILTSGGGSEGIGFAVPINVARKVTEQLMAHGKVVRGYLGASLRPLTAELAKAFNIPPGRGAFVVRVAPDSPAAEAGLKEGDIVLQVNGQVVKNSRTLENQIADSSPGSRMQLKVSRIGRQQMLTAQLTEFEAHSTTARGGAE